MAEREAFDVSGHRVTFGGCGRLWNAPLLAYEMRTRKAMRRKSLAPPKLCDLNLEEEAFAEALRRIAAALKS